MHPRKNIIMVRIYFHTVSGPIQKSKGLLEMFFMIQAMKYP